MLRTGRLLGVMQIFKGRTRLINNTENPCPVFYQEFSVSPLINFNPSPSCVDSSQLSHDLWEAASAGRADTTRLLLASGADPNLLVAINVVLLFVPCLEKDWIDVDVHLPGGGQLQRPHRGGRRPGGAQGHRRQRHRIWRLDSAYVGGMVGVSLFKNGHLFWYRYGHTRVVEVLLGAPKVDVDKLNQESTKDMVVSES